MKRKPFPVFLSIIIVGLSAIPLQQVDAKQIFGGDYDLIISVGKPADAFGSQTMYIPKESLDLLIEDLDKIQPLVSDTILPQIKERFLEHKDELKDHYIENLQIIYDMSDNTLDILISTVPQFCYTESCAHQIVKVEPSTEARMSVINHVYIFMSIYATLLSSDEFSYFDVIERETMRRTQAMVDHAKETMNNHRSDLLAGALTGEGSLANTIPMGRIVMRILENVVRTVVLFPPDNSGTLVTPIDEIAAVRMEDIPEFPVNLMIITAIGLIGVLVGLRLKGRNSDISTRFKR